MKKFEMPKMDVEKFEIADVITTSDCGIDCDGYYDDGDNVCKRD